MLVGINASFLRKSDSGIGQVTRNFLKKLRELKVKSEKLKGGNLKFFLYLEEDINLDLPNSFEKKVILPRCYRRDDLIRKIFWEKWLLPREAEKDRCDVLLSLYQSATKLNRSSGQKRNGNIKHIMLVHDTIWKIFPQYINNWRKKIYYDLVDNAILKADKIITISENSKRDIIKFFKTTAGKISVNYIDCDEIFKNQEKESGKKEKVVGDQQSAINNYIFYVGGFDIRKNVDRLIKSYGVLWEKWSGDKINFPDLVLAGNFHKNLVPLITNIPSKIKEVSAKYNLPEEKIKMFGFIKQKDLPAWYKNAKLFCYPSLYEGFGLPVLEAMNCGCPIITSNTSSIPEVCSGNSALLINPENTGEIAEAMGKMLADENLAEEKIANAKKEAEKFNWDKFTEEMLNQIRDFYEG